MILIKQKKWITFLVAAVVVVAVFISIKMLWGRSEEYIGKDKAAVVTNGIECSDIASEILRKGGSVADAAVSALLCEGVTCAQSTGLGGGFVMSIFRKEANTVETLIARDVAPLAATEDMFVNVTSVTGGKAIAVPGELKGYWELHQKYGKLDWAQLFDPVIKLCRKGHIVSSYLAGILSQRKQEILDSPTLKEIYLNPVTNDVYQEGDFIKRNKLADTFEIIQKEGVDSMYNNGTVAQMIVQDIKDVGGIITIEDLMKYEVRWKKPITIHLKDNKKLHTIPLPGSGPLVAFILNILNDYLPEKESTVAMQRIAEAFKFAYAKRTELGDDKFVNTTIEVVKNLTNFDFAMEIRKQIHDDKTFNDYTHYGAKFSNKDDHGTVHINIIAPNGDAIVATGTINSKFGCKIVSTKTGIILNDGMDDFSVPGVNNAYEIPPSPANFIRPQKMPLSSMCPTILLDENNDVEVLIGAAGGSKITSSVAYVLLRYLYFKESIEDAVHAPRIHHQLVPMHLEYEMGFNQELIEDLSRIGHEMYKSPTASGFASLTAIGRNGKRLAPVFDPRRGGSTAVF